MKFSLAFTLLLLASPTHAGVVIYSNDVEAQIEPCGCRDNPAGGFVRRQALLFKYKARAQLQLDAGDLLFESRTVPDPLRHQAMVQAHYVVTGMNRMGLDAVSPGEKDFALGLSAFTELRKKAKFTFLSANLYRGKKLFLKPHQIFTLKSFEGPPKKVAVFGLTGEDLTLPKELRVLPVVSAAKKQIAALSGKADVVIALTHQGLELDQRLAEQVQGIDIIIGAHTQSFLQVPETVNKTKIYQSSYQNQYIGLIDLDTNPHIHNLVELGNEYDRPKSKMTKFVARFKSAIAKLNTEEEQKEIQKNTKVDYQTFPSCVGCHQVQFDFWRGTHHANALAPLLKAKQIRNKQCIECHSLGVSAATFLDIKKIAEVEKPQSYLTPEKLSHFMSEIHGKKPLSKKSSKKLRNLSKAWAPVQCENCHGAAGKHPFSGAISKSVHHSTCLKCHTQKQAPKWYTQAGKPNLKLIQAKTKLIACPADE